MALSIKKKKDESTNEKIVRLFQEGKSVDEICEEIELRYDIVANVIRRKLGDDAVPETVITAKPKTETAETADTNEAEEELNYDGMSKLERYMLEKKKKQEEEAQEAQSENRVSLVDDYMRQSDSVKETVPVADTTTQMDSISLDDVPPLEPVNAAPAEAAEPVEMDSISAVELAEADASAENNFAPAEPAPADESPAVDTEPENASKAVDKMKAYALSQIESNNATIAELEAKSAQLEQTYAPELEAANKALNLSQDKYENADAKLTKAYDDIEKAREEHRIAIAKADEDYRRKLEEIDAQYKNATAEANDKLREFEDSSRATIESLDKEKSDAQADLSAKQSAVTDLRAKISTDADEIAAQINGLKDENEGYKNFIK